MGKENDQGFTFLLSLYTLNSQITQTYPEVLWIKLKVTLLSPCELKLRQLKDIKTSLDQSCHCLQLLKTNDRVLSTGNSWAITCKEKGVPAISSNISYFLICVVKFIKAMVLIWRQFYFHSIWQCLETFSIVTPRRDLLTSHP